MTTPAMSDPMEFIRSLWGNLQTPLPGLLPTVDAGELERRITDLKAVEAWLQTNAQMVRMTIQNLEVQRATLAVLSAATSAKPAPADDNAGAALNVANWPFQFMQTAADLLGTAAGATTAPKAKTAAKPRKKSSGS